MKRIGIVEDDRGLNGGIVLALKNDEYDFVQTYSIGEAEKLDWNNLDLLILDVNLPDGNGFDLLRKIRQNYELPVILLTANDTEMDEVRGLQLGADDYITKPFSLMVLRARIETVLKRRGSVESHLFENDVFRFDFDKLVFRKNDQSVELSRTEQKLLKVLIDNRGRKLTRTMLIDAVWTDGAEFVDENALSVSIKRLRDKLEENPAKPEYIQTVYGIGYIWRNQ
ncbi:MAG: response regulator transcription factor [Alistipes sp.]|nr:response regulator transcription factor [Alistipes sp.]